MKRFICLCGILFLVGCNNDKIINEHKYSYNHSFYSVFEPYKEGQSNYSAGRLFNRYDLKEVELGLMRLATKYFIPAKYYYQAGQYLTKDDLDELLSYDKLNKIETELKYQPKYISYIHEQNYLNLKGEVKGIALGIVLNPYQTYTNESGQIKQEVIDKEELLQVGKEKAQELVTYIKAKPTLKNVEVLIGLYVSQSTSSMISGSYVAETFIKKDIITKFNELNEQYYLLTNTTLKTIDEQTYEGFIKLKEKLDKDGNIVNIMGRGLYINDQLHELTIDININYISIGKMNALAQIIAEEVLRLFKREAMIEVIIKNENKVEAIIVKDNEENKGKIFFIN